MHIDTQVEHLGWRLGLETWVGRLAWAVGGDCMAGNFPAGCCEDQRVERSRCPTKVSDQGVRPRCPIRVYNLCTISTLNKYIDKYPNEYIHTYTHTYIHAMTLPRDTLSSVFFYDPQNSCQISFPSLPRVLFSFCLYVLSLLVNVGIDL